MSEVKKLAKLKDSTIKEDLPRERLISNGTTSLSLVELITIIIGVGVKGLNASDVAYNLLNKYKSLNTLATITVAELIKERGIGFATACRIATCFEISRRIQLATPQIKTDCSTPNKIHKLLIPILLNKTREQVAVISLNSRFKLICLDIISEGTVNEALIHPREVFKSAILSSASYVVIAHNHPSGDHSPSLEDLKITERLTEISRLVGIPLLDHIIISENGYHSIRNTSYTRPVC